MTISKVFTTIAIMKYTKIGMKDSLLSGPNISVNMALTTIINNPETAVPTVNFDTTSCDR